MSQGSHAPIVRFVEPDGPEDQGRDGMMVSPPIRTEVGMSVPLTIEVTNPEGTAADWWVKWALHSSPGDVTFVPDEIDLQDGE